MQRDCVHASFKEMGGDRPYMYVCLITIVYVRRVCQKKSRIGDELVDAYLYLHRSSCHRIDALHSKRRHHSRSQYIILFTLCFRV